MTVMTQRKLNQWALLFHIRKTFALVGAVLGDRRVHWLPKATFLGCLGALLIALLGGDAVSELVSSVLPVVGPVLGIPIDGSIDWVVFAVAAFNLLKLFPSDVVGEHYDRLFRSGRRAA